MGHLLQRTRWVWMWCALTGLVVFGVVVNGCAPHRVTTLAHPALKKARVERICVIPFLKGRHPTNVKQTLNCNLCQLAFEPSRVAIGADMTLTRYTYEIAKARYAGRVVPDAEVERAYRGLGVDESTDTPVSLAQRVGHAVGANLVILGTVWRYIDRVGGPAGSTRPASVAFDLYLLDVPTGELLWMANFDETQRALSENIWDAGTFFSRGSKWLSANELARFGVKEVFRKLPI